MKESRALAQRQNAARHVRTGLICALAALLAFAAGRPASGAQLPGMGGLAGRVTVKKPLGFLTVYAFNTDKDVGYMVYVVGGKYRATNLFPGHYDVTLRGTVGQLDWSLPSRRRTSRSLRESRVPLISALPRQTSRPPILAAWLIRICRHHTSTRRWFLQRPVSAGSRSGCH